MNFNQLVGAAWLHYSRATPNHRGKHVLARSIDSLFGPFRMRSPAGVWLEAYASSPMDMSYLEQNRTADHVIFDALKRLESGWTFIDVGANTGYYSILAGKRVGDAGRVYALEPSPREFRRLLSAIELNRATNVVPINVALSDRSGDAFLDISAHHTGLNYLVDGNTNSRVIRTAVVPGDALLLPFLASDTLIKIDVEGAELRVIAGMPRLLADPRVKAIVAEVTPKFLARFGDTKRELYAQLHGVGFTPTHSVDLWQYDELWLR